MSEYDEKSISLCPVESSHSDFLFRLFMESRPDLSLINGLNDEQKLNIILQQFTMEEQQLNLMFPNADFNIVMINNEPIGRFYVYHGENSYRILELALLNQYSGFGIGTKLMTTVIEDAIKVGKKITLQVAWFNERAYKFYERLGFKIIENRGVALEMQHIN